MGILVECPICHRKQSTKNKHCAACGDHLDKQKRNGKARYWVVTRLPGGKQRKEFLDAYRPKVDTISMLMKNAKLMDRAATEIFDSHNFIMYPFKYLS